MNTTTRQVETDLTLDQLAEFTTQFDQSYKNVSIAQQLRKAVFKIAEDYTGKHRCHSTLEINDTGDTIEEKFTIDVEGVVSISGKMSSQCSSNSRHTVVKNVSSHLQFNKFMYELKYWFRDGKEKPLEEMFRKLFNIPLSDYSCQLEFNEGDFDMLMESKLHRHQFSIFVQALD